MPESSPFRDNLGLEFDGQRLVGHPQEDKHTNMGGTVHGGLLMTMLDSVMGGVVVDELPEDKSTVTASMTVHFIAPAQPGSELVAEASITKAGGTLVYVEGWITADGSPDRIATATAVFAVVDKEK